MAFIARWLKAFRGSGGSMVYCTKCGTKNRIPLNRLSDGPVCGRCREPLQKVTAYDRPLDISDRTFNEEVIRHSGPVLVDCWAPWCGPCRMVAPALEQLARGYAGRIKITKLNVDENPLTASQFSVQSIPTMLLFLNGKLVDTLVGALPKQEIEKIILRMMSS